MTFNRRTLPAQCVSIILLVVFGFLCSLPRIGTDAKQQLAQQFAFIGHEVPAHNAELPFLNYDVHPSLMHAVAWYSAFGAQVAIGDLDGDGLDNDVVHLDPRSGTVALMDFPSSKAARYPTQPLDLGPGVDGQRRFASCCRILDANEDGWNDLIIGYVRRGPRLYLRQPTLPLQHENAFVAQDLITGTQPLWHTTSIVINDLDGDGHQDLFIGNYWPDNSTIFEPNSATLPTLNEGFTRALGGGHNYIFLWQSAQQGTTLSARYKLVEPEWDSDAQQGWTVGVAACDIDGDGLDDLYVANDHGPDRLFHNRSEPGKIRLQTLTGAWHPGVPKSHRIGHDAFKGMGVDFADINHDGYWDCYVSNIGTDFAYVEGHMLWQHSGNNKVIQEDHAPFTQQARQRGLWKSAWAWDAKFGDFNNDGQLELTQTTGFTRGEIDAWPDVLEMGLANDAILRSPFAWTKNTQSGKGSGDVDGYAQNPFFAADATGYYWDIADQVGMQEPDLARGISLCDYNGDGALDLFMANLWQVSRAYTNHSPNPGNFCAIRILHPVAQHNSAPREVPEALLGWQHPPGIGFPATGAILHFKDHNGRSHMGRIDGGNGSFGQRAPTLHFGVGAQEGPFQADLRWRNQNGRLQTAKIEITTGWQTILLPNTAHTDPTTLAQHRNEEANP